MEFLTLENVLVKRNWRFHILILLFSLVVVAITTVASRGSFTSEDFISLLILLTIQMELFMAAAVKIFRDVKPGHERREITRILLSRFVLFMVICFIVALVVVLVFVLIRSVIHGADARAEVSDFFALKFEGWVKGTLGGLLFGAAIFIFIQWQDALKREQRLREENLIFQNETLKSQINPHFLFNNLNTLSSLIAKRPEAAELFISKLSSIYRYIIENSVKDRVPLVTEIEFIKDYFYLYMIRDEEKISLDIDIRDAESKFILPVSLQVLVENAVKHNKATREEPLYISVCLEGDYVVVKNNLQRLASQMKSTGIGLRNLAERVRLSTDRPLVIEETNESYTVKLPVLI